MELSFHSSIFWWIISLIVIPLESAKVSPGIDHLYASSLHRRAQVLENVASLAIIESTPTISECLVMCMQNKPNCKAINFSKSNATCVLLKESLCSNETYELTENEHFHYYDIMNSPEEEEKHYKDQYCQFYGKCSNKCYPRTRKLILLPEKVESKLLNSFSALFVEERMTRTQAHEYCQSMGRSLPQPKTQTENTFYGEFGRKAANQFWNKLRLLNETEQALTGGNKTKIAKVLADKMVKEYKVDTLGFQRYWVIEMFCFF